jgi:hypothetical protein
MSILTHATKQSTAFSTGTLLPYIKAAKCITLRLQGLVMNESIIMEEGQYSTSPKIFSTALKLSMMRDKCGAAAAVLSE